MEALGGFSPEMIEVIIGSGILVTMLLYAASEIQEYNNIVFRRKMKSESFERDLQRKREERAKQGPVEMPLERPTREIMRRGSPPNRGGKNWRN